MAYAMDYEVAEELIALLRDDEGDADEDILDEARTALERSIEPRDARFDQLLIWLTASERTAVLCALDEQAADAVVLARLGDVLQRRLTARLQD